ncbi:hypothetical protein WMY93_026876 [Mugilogobius chulae]|uniref:Uncharacterized protein n=1 Tax=Mugilogobius chulae TaxID=88201 RepID=A0AAW0NAN7_9GOBI
MRAIKPKKQHGLSAQPLGQHIVPLELPYVPHWPNPAQWTELAHWPVFHQRQDQLQQMALHYRQAPTLQVTQPTPNPQLVMNQLLEFRCFHCNGQALYYEDEWFYSCGTVKEESSRDTQKMITDALQEHVSVHLNWGSMNPVNKQQDEQARQRFSQLNPEQCRPSPSMDQTSVFLSEVVYAANSSSPWVLILSHVIGRLAVDEGEGA